MRWRIRWQLLVPPLTLLVSVLGISLWLAVVSAEQARRQIEERVRSVVRNLTEETSYPLTENVLGQMKLLSGADYLLVPKEGPSIATLPAGIDVPTAAGAADDWQTLTLGPPVVVSGRTYRCSGVHLTRPPREGDTLYILYPEAQWRDARWEAMWPVVALGISAGLASVGLAVGLGRGLSRRVGELERRTRLIADGDFSPMPLPSGDDEIRDLARSINDMVARLASLQETVRRAERLRLLGQVSGGLAHQVRNGLTGARLALQQFSRELPANTDQAALDVALRQLTLLETNLKRFLDLGSEGRRRDPCNLALLIGEAVDLLRPRCHHAAIDLRWYPPRLPASVTGDPGQLGQLVVNVLGNAIEAAGPNGWVEVRIWRVERIADQNGSGPSATEDNPAGVLFSSLQSPESPAEIVLEVRDSGPGPAPEVAGRLFEPFVTGKPEGVGLGLAVARQIVEAHGGSISWSREADHTCFRVRLPLRSEAAKPRAELETTHP
jgi:signal transduction histidine kinase